MTGHVLVIAAGATPLHAPFCDRRSRIMRIVFRSVPRRLVALPMALAGIDNIAIVS
jgi:hypothetical protein